MLGLLPDLTPRDSHSVWYTSARNPLQNPPLDPTAGQPSDPHRPPNQNDHPHRRHAQSLLERTQLARLRADEAYADRRRENIHNFGATWLRPPGIAKTLHQKREEEREAAEHAEAMRREQVQAELAEAAGEGDEEFDPEGESGMDDMGDGARDLDDDIPDADGTGMSGIEVQSVVSSDLPSSALDEEEDNDTREVEERQSELIQARMRMGNDAFRQAMARGDADAGDMYGAEEELEAEDEGQLLLEEESSAHFREARERLLDDGDGVDMDMDADLDASVQEAGGMSGVYEHTDSEAEMSSSLPSSSSAGSVRRGGDDEDEDEDEDDVGFVPRSSVGGMVGGGELRMPTSPTLAAREDRAKRMRQDLDLSSLLSGGDSSVLDSSPARR